MPQAEAGRLNELTPFTLLKERAKNNFPRSPVSALWQGLPTLPPGRPEVSEPNRRPETFGQADGGVWTTLPSASDSAAGGLCPNLTLNLARNLNPLPNLNLKSKLLPVGSPRRTRVGRKNQSKIRIKSKIMKMIKIKSKIKIRSNASTSDMLSYPFISCPPANRFSKGVECVRRLRCAVSQWRAARGSGRCSRDRFARIGITALIHRRCWAANS